MRASITCMSMDTNINELLTAIRALPVRDRLKLIEHVVHDIASDDAPATDRDPISVADVMENVREAAMVARERDPLRLSNG